MLSQDALTAMRRERSANRSPIMILMLLERTWPECGPSAELPIGKIMPRRNSGMHF